ncbi:MULTISPECIES: RHS repeat-associated core domain-containing protein [unclassified Anoxybacillus]|uniref:RHS repeat domain-containing protein n=1 Tax=unclassified Anoxybacillus TaxID=2639704 RepID=UPI001EDC299B|nr:hypothetical protein [Anoxybacillus sp. LAT27]MCG5025941.1 hypothetical protein [Anoxybacillus flavithermus]
MYDDENRLIQVKNASGTTIATYTYDHQGRRISKTTSSGTTYYHYDGDSIRLLYETDANNNITAEYTWDALGRPVTMTKAGATYYYHLNGHGDVVALTDASGNVVAQYEYDAWGNILSKTGALASANPYRYAGYYYDEETGLYYLMARYYEANMGRFLTRDTFHGVENEPQSLNQYVYTKNNPVMYVDPSGHIPIIVAEALVGVFINAVGYVAELVAKYGTRNAFKHFSGKKFAVELLKGAATGAIGGGIVSKLAKAGQLSKVAEKFLAGHLAPAAYLVSNFGDFSAGSFTENQILSMFNNNVGILWATAKPYVKKIYEKYKKWL